MNCFLCQKSISKNSVTGLCLKCKTNRNLVSSRTQVKKIYRLTDDELETGMEEKKLRYYTFNFHGECTKFVLQDIELYAQELFNNIDSSDKRKQKYEENMANRAIL
jgi:hypothetical protein